MAGALQAHAQVVALVLDEGVPGAVFQGHEAVVDFGEEAFDELLIAGEADLEGIFDHQGQQPGRGDGAEDGAGVAGGQQVGQSADVVDVHVGDHKRQDVVHGEGHAVLFEAVLALGILALEEATVDQQGPVGVQLQAVAAASDAGGAAVVGELGHGGSWAEHRYIHSRRCGSSRIRS
ncbi:hypothetical protein SAMN05444515_12415 [Ectothiorhodospira marina]|uniref:Uncharacterized protein n=1 Tax=Ectothiorhodospira marina TaxID=1396821 RepID=A0A1H7RLW6_9GAMM|nr:hypothetical protein SAMN05444515_12415 [Ectothiorhodospira marina]